jgi:starch synthase (maltosyl-transferring)
LTGRIGIEDVFPEVDGGRYPAKGVAGDYLPIRATVWREGHGALGAHVRWRSPDGDVTRIPMRCVDEGADRWQAVVVPDRPGAWTFQVEAWGDPWLTLNQAIDAKIGAGFTADQLANDLESAARLLSGHARSLERVAAVLRDTSRPLAERVGAARSAEVEALLAADPVREFVTSGPARTVWADRPRALFGSWYELFPRSTGGRDADGRPVHGTFATTAEELPRIAELGFDVVYLPPIHPIGRLARKGRNNATTAEPGEVGSPWAVGAAEGGHDAIHPELGTLADFDALVARARELDLEIALDLAFQCAPDHPWVTAHPEWFTTRPDGTIACAENPPKTYEDIYPLNFDQDREGLHAELLRVTRFWIEHGVRIFRVDNPHTKPLDFWHRFVWDVKSSHPDVLFLAEAFTRPAMQRGLAKLGFTQSYTYFTWRESKAELTGYLTELVDAASFFTPNFFVNTPDILPAHLQDGNPASFAIRAALAATLSPSWGMYAGFELLEHEPVQEGGEEYLNSEKYELRPRDHAAARREGRSLEPWIAVLNKARRDHPALRQLRTLRFHPVDNEALIAFSKTDPATGDTVLCVITLDPTTPQRGTVRLGGRFKVRDEVDGRTGEWGPATRVTIDPARAVAQILAVTEA